MLSTIESTAAVSTVLMTGGGAKVFQHLRISGFLDITFDIVDTVFGTAVSELL